MAAGNNVGAPGGDRTGGVALVLGGGLAASALQPAVLPGGAFTAESATAGAQGTMRVDARAGTPGTGKKSGKTLSICSIL